jgi:hypothetical protein
MPDLVRAVEREYRKLGRLTLDTDFGHYLDHLTRAPRNAEPRRPGRLWPGARDVATMTVTIVATGRMPWKLVCAPCGTG